MKKTLKIETGKRRSKWHKHVSFAVLNYNTSYHTSTGCKHSKKFLQSAPDIVFYLQKSIRPQKLSIRKSQDVHERTGKIIQDMDKNVVQAYIKYTTHYDMKLLLLNSKRAITSLRYNLKQTINAVIFFSLTSVGLSPISLRKLQQIIIIW